MRDLSPSGDSKIVGFSESTQQDRRRGWVGRRKSTILNRLIRTTPSEKNEDNFIKNYNEAVRYAVQDADEFKKIQRKLRESKFVTNQGFKVVICKYFEGNDSGKYVV
jgi:hypothetical protein